MRRAFAQILAPSACLWLVLSMSACGDGSLGSLFTKREAANTQGNVPAPRADRDADDDKDVPTPPSVWPTAHVVNEEDFKLGIPDSGLSIKFQADNLDGFDIQCRAANVAQIAEKEKKACKDVLDVKDYEKNVDFRFELYAVHKASKAERLLASSDFRTDPIQIIVPQELPLLTQYAGVAYLTMQITPALQGVYYTCSTTSDLVFDPTMDCRAGALRLEFSRFNGTVRLRILAWSLNTNKLLAKRNIFFCSGYICTRTIEPGSPPPYQ